MSRFLNRQLQPMKAYTPGEQPSGRTFIKLNTNESPYPPSPAVIRAVNEALLNDLRLYSSLTGSPLREALAEQLGVEADQVVVANGSDEILALAMYAFGERGVTYPDVTYGFYQVWADFYGLKRRVVRLTGDFTIRPEDFHRNEAMVLLANPNAPTGIALELDALREIARKNPDHIVLIDEAYIAFGAESALPLIDEFENVLIVRTFSKSHALAGARLGYAVGNEALIRDLDKVRFSFHPYNVNALSAHLGAAAIADRAYYDDLSKKIIAARAYTMEALTGMGFEALDSSANFIFARHPMLYGDAYVQKLRERGILVRRFDGERIADFARITIGTISQMERVVSETRDILREENYL